MNIGLVDLYKAILKTGWLITDEKNYVYRDLSSVSGENKEPFILLDKQVALPTRENLNNSGKENLLIFHPLLEGLIGGNHLLSVSFVELIVSGLPIVLPLCLQRS
jgi:hypothetical protein